VQAASMGKYVFGFGLREAKEEASKQGKEDRQAPTAQSA